MILDVLSLDGGKKQGDLEVSDAFSTEFNESLVHQVVVSIMAGSRAGTKAQKTRSEVSGGGAKPWRQKGTGRARAGTIRSPLWRSGGCTFAAKPTSYEQKVNRKMYRGALRSVVSELIRQSRLMVVEEMSIAEPKTRLLRKKLTDMDLSEALIVTLDDDRNLNLASRNLYRVDAVQASSVDLVSLIAFSKVVVTRDALKKIEERIQ